MTQPLLWWIGSGVVWYAALAIGGWPSWIQLRRSTRLFGLVFHAVGGPIGILWTLSLWLPRRPK